MGAWQGHEFSAHVLLLPYLEQRPLYDALNLSDIKENGTVVGPFYNQPAQATAVTTSVDVFLCPSDIDRCTWPDGHNNYGATTPPPPKRLYRHFVETGGTVRTTADTVVVRFHKRSHNPILREAALDREPVPIPWLGNRRIEFQLP
jgi:hypothetical protein